jgi:NAD(P)-dependent dehydrogenase (short-subunit alcohol dehydrogenase family)
MGDRLAGKRVIVTGAGSGIGRAASLRMIEEGASVACVDLFLDTAEETASQANAAALSAAGGGKAVALAADVSKPEDAERMTAEAVAALGGIDAVYANAGIAGTGTAETTTWEEWNRVIAVNLTGVWLSSRYALPHMKEAGGGSIINQASVGGIIGVPGIFPYAAAKAGVIGLSRQMAVDYGQHAIRVNALCPGTVPTPLVTATYEKGGGMGRGGPDIDAEERIARAAARYPLGHLGDVTDIANMALFLASDEARWITGGVYVVDGGLTAA